ncbi:MAG: hypothetical protein Q9160_003856 [Pyrenula sp. 1 TL-2023]
MSSKAQTSGGLKEGVDGSQNATLEKDSESKAEATPDLVHITYMTGWRLHAATFGLSNHSLKAVRYLRQETADALLSIDIYHLLGGLWGGSNADTTPLRLRRIDTSRFSVPMGAAAFAILLVAMPARLGHEPAAVISRDIPGRNISSLQTLKRIDLGGAVLLLGTTILLSTALQQAAEGYSFTSATVLPLLIISAALCVVFLVWQRHVTLKTTSPEPIFPWRFVKNRLMMGMLIISFLSGNVLVSAVVQIPQRFMTVNGKSAIAAGVRLLPWAILTPAGSTLGAVLMGRPKIPPIYLLILGSALELAGVVGLSQTSSSLPIRSSQYGFQVLGGAGVGVCSVALAMLVPYVTEKRDLAVGTGAVTQFRILGGVIGLSIVTSVSLRSIRENLSSVVPPLQVETLLDRTDTIQLLQGATRKAVREIFGNGYNLQMTILIGFAAAQSLGIVLMWRRKSIVVSS